jgi:hypothetical protein
VTALPPDPRGGPIGIRAASFSPTSGQLAYNVIFTRVKKTEEPFRGVMQLVVTGQRNSGKLETVSLSPVPMSLETFQQLSGSIELPAGMVPREIMIRVLRGTSGEMLSMRVFKI